ncbi:MAG TPA: hypothetical protein EYP10_15510, partial [Armatimonadetes bacterium]|nr:hypothetical protein [Armatimonadota bacterium]
MNGKSNIISEIAKRLGVNEEEVIRTLRATAEVTGAKVVELPPYFEEYIRSVLEGVRQGVA